MTNKDLSTHKQDITVEIVELLMCIGLIAFGGYVKSITIIVLSFLYILLVIFTTQWSPKKRKVRQKLVY